LRIAHVWLLRFFLEIGDAVARVERPIAYAPLTSTVWRKEIKSTISSVVTMALA
jgi:hypothetical protein